MLLLLGFLLVVPAYASDEIRQALEACHAKQNCRALKVTYSDLHGLHGGISLVFRGDGKVEQKAVRHPKGAAEHISKEEFGRLVSRLLELEAWTQKTPERKAVPDELWVTTESGKWKRTELDDLGMA